MDRPLLWLGIYLFVAVSGESQFTKAKSNNDAINNVFTALRPGHLLAYWPLIENAFDYAPFGSFENGYLQHGTSHGVAQSVDGWNSTNGRRFDGNGSISTPVNINGYLHPKLTMGSWVKVQKRASSDIASSRVKRYMK